MSTPVLVVANVKGGVAKTTTTLCLSIMLHLLRARILVIDIDPQGNTTDGLGYTPDLLEHTVYSLMMGKSTLQQTLKQTYFNTQTGAFFDPTDPEDLERLNIALVEKRAMRGPDLLPCNISAAAAENELLSDPLWGSLLSKVLSGIESQYDFIVIDTHPGLSKLTVNAFLVATHIIIPSVPERWPTSGIRLLSGAIANAHKMNTKLQVAGICFTRVRYAEHRKHMDLVREQTITEVNETFPWMNLSIFETYVNESANFSRTMSERSNIILAVPADAISVLYWGFLAELLKKIQHPFFDAAVKMYQQQYKVYQEDQTKAAERKQAKRPVLVEEKK